VKVMVNSCGIPGARRWLAVVMLALCSTLVLAGSPAIKVSNARIRMLPGDLPLAGYFDLHNSGSKTVSLTGASSPDFGGVMMHMSMHKHGEASMTMVDKIDIKPGKSVSFTPGGYHLMLMHRKQQLTVGDEVSIKLEFSGGHSMAVQFRVGGAAIQ